jgi:hypothetical protein
MQLFANAHYSFFRERRVIEKQVVILYLAQRERIPYLMGCNVIKSNLSGIERGVSGISDHTEPVDRLADCVGSGFCGIAAAGGSLF